jgi:pilus assembly protein FimV
MSIGSGFVTEAETAQGVSVQSDEVDPIAESEIYLAYGRNDQAEQVLTDAIRGSPDRLELKIKLLEVFQAQGNVEGFTSMAEMLGTQIDHGSAEWAQIVRMAREVAPDNAKLQDDTIADSAPETPGDSATQSEVQEITFDTISDGGTPAAKDTVPQDEIQEIAFDPVSEGGGEVAEESAPQDELQDIEFDLSEPEETPKPEPNQSEDLEETPAADPIDDGIEFILEPEGELSQAQESETVLEDEPTDMDSLEQASDTDVGTRLDLARAYIEMGDAAAARTLLEEVKQLGTPSEREEAESLMANLLADTD